MNLTKKECDLLYNMINASILMAKNSGIPIGKEYYEIIDSIKNKLEQETRNTLRSEYYAYFK